MAHADRKHIGTGAGHAHAQQVSGSGGEPIATTATTRSGSEGQTSGGR